MISCATNEDGSIKSSIVIDEVVEVMLQGLLKEISPGSESMMLMAMKAAYRMGWAQCRAAREQYQGRFDSSKIIGMTEHGDKVYAVAPVVWADAASPFSAEQVKNLLEENEKLRKQRDDLVTDRVASWGDDQPLPEDEETRKAHPVRSDDHQLYSEAMRMVGAKNSKYGLVDLVNMLLHRIEKAKNPCRR